MECLTRAHVYRQGSCADKCDLSNYRAATVTRQRLCSHLNTTMSELELKGVDPWKYWTRLAM